MPEEFSAEFLRQCSRYLGSNDASLRDCADPLNLSPNAFLHRLRQAYEAGFIVVTSPEKRDLRIQLEDWWRSQEKPIRGFVASGSPDDSTFARAAAEAFLRLLRDVLNDKALLEVNIGIVSGSSTGLVFDELVQGRLWDEIMGGVDAEGKTIRVIALNVTPVVGWELRGNANISVLKFAVLLRDRLSRVKQITPYGLSTMLVVSEANLRNVDDSPSNRTVVELTDPNRLGTNKMSQLNLVITGVGSPDNSIFQRVLQEENLTAPPEMVGDVAFWPVDKLGAEVHLTRASKTRNHETEECLIYSAVRLETLRHLTRTGRKVMLVARNRRLENKVHKTPAIKAAILGEYANYLVTDEQTARDLIGTS